MYNSVKNYEKYKNIIKIIKINFIFYLQNLHQ